MASYQRYRNEDGTTSIVAQVRIKPFKPIAKSFPTKPAAKDWADAKERELREQRKHGADRTDLPSLTVRTLVTEFLADGEMKALAYFDDLERLCAWWTNEFGANKVADIGVLKLRAARDTLVGDGLANSTVNRYLSAFRSCWNWARAGGLMPQERGWPSRLLLTEPRGRVRYLTDEELEAILEAGKAHSPVMHAAILVSLATGVRQGELLRMSWADVDLDRQRVRIPKTKNDEPRAVHLPAVAVEALKALKELPVVSAISVFVSDDGKPLVKAHLDKRWRGIRTSAGLKNFRWHDLRHSCASFLAQKGATLLEIGSVLGHKSPSVTMRYSHLVAGAPVTGSAELDEKLRGKL
jgi:integrase